MSNALLARVSVVITCALVWSGCVVHKAETPGLAGPSEFGLSFGITATPDAISQDGASNSSIIVRAFDENGKPKSAVSFRLDMLQHGQPVDYGTLSTKSVVTGSDGRATAVYTAPPPLPNGTNTPTCQPSFAGADLPGSCIQIAATAVGADMAGGVSQKVEIRLVPLGVIQSPASTPTAQFTFDPSGPPANSPVVFDASTSCPGQTQGGSACALSEQVLVSYAWDFGDGSTANTKIASHTFKTARTYSVTLTVTNDRGRAASTTKTVTVGAGSAPSAAFTFGPTPAVVDSMVFFDASGSRPGLGHTIAGYKWNFGDGDTTDTMSSPLQDHDYLKPGTFTVTLTVTDEAGQIGTTTQSITVTAGAPIADFSFVISNPGTHTVSFDGRSSTTQGGATITDYSWIFGDSDTGTGATPTHSYPGADPHPSTYSVKLTITDSTGKVGTVQKSVTVP